MHSLRLGWYRAPLGEQMRQDIIEAHRLSFRNRAALETSETCGCFFCLKTCRPNEIMKWIDKRSGLDETGLCPHCRIDSLLGSSSGFPVTTDFLRDMRDYWFSKPTDL